MRRIDNRTYWGYFPKEIFNLNSFDEIQDLYDSVGADFLIPVRIKYTHNLSDKEFIEKINTLDLNEEGKTPLQTYVLKNLKNDRDYILLKNKTHVVKCDIAQTNNIFIPMVQNKDLIEENKKMLIEALEFLNMQ